MQEVGYGNAILAVEYGTGVYYGMNKRDRAKVEEALFHLMDNEGADYTRGIALLCELVGKRYPAYHDTQGLKSITIQELEKRGPSEFRFPGDGKGPIFP